MATFPINLLVPEVGTLSGELGNVTIEIPIKPFELIVNGSALRVETSLSLNFVILPTIELSELSAKTFRFPKNPSDGYIDASIYIEHAHHPVDITRIMFGSLAEGNLAVGMDAELMLEHEGLGSFLNTRWPLWAILRRA